jgi:hypothetical protein
VIVDASDDAAADERSAMNVGKDFRVEVVRERMRDVLSGVATRNHVSVIEVDPHPRNLSGSSDDMHRLVIKEQRVSGATDDMAALVDRT